MSDYPLVSIITPCYNGEAFLDRYFKSILSQTYPNIELIFVNDGSTDRTEEIALSYKDKLEDKGISYNYIYQNNMGPPGAINTGLQNFSGKYLTWPDSDDWMTPDCIKKKVDYLENHRDKALVQCRSALVAEENINEVIGVIYRKDNTNGWFFEDLILEKDAVFACGSYMVRSDAFLETHPTKHIFDENGAGQNYQMLLPVLYKYECGFLPDVLYYIVISQKSHSHREKDFDSNIQKTYNHQEILLHVLHEIDMSKEERCYYLNIIEIKYIRRRMEIAAQFHEKEELKKYYNELRSKGKADRYDRLRYIRWMFPPFDWGIRVVLYGNRVVRYMIRRFKHD